MRANPKIVCPDESACRMRLTNPFAESASPKVRSRYHRHRTTIQNADDERKEWCTTEVAHAHYDGGFDRVW